MPEVSKLALNAGELSDELAGRIDLSKFNMGCEILENARVLRAGGVTRRAGFKHVGDVEDNARQTRLVGFRFSAGQGYILEFSHLTMRVIQNGVIDATVHVTPWTEDQIFALQFAQRIDRIVVTHPEVEVQNIIKYAGGTWGVEVYPWKVRVWEEYLEVEDITMTPSALTGTGETITSSVALFDATWVGDRIQISHSVAEVKSEFDDGVVVAPYFNETTGTYIVGDLTKFKIGSDDFFYTCYAAYDGAAGDYDIGLVDPADYPQHFYAGVEMVPDISVERGWVFETFGTWDGSMYVQRSYNAGASWETIKVISSSDDRNERLVETETQDTLIRVLAFKWNGGTNQRVDFTVNSYVDFGHAVVTVYNSTTEVEVDIEEDFIALTASGNWKLCAFSTRQGFPSGVTFYQGRLALGGTTAKPQTLWLSRTNAPFDFTLGTLATDGMSFETDAEGFEAITWLSSHLSLLVGTTLGVWAISSPDGSPLTPESNNLNRQMEVGAEDGFQAAHLQNNILFLQYSGRKVQELTGGSVEYGGYLSTDLTQLATHVTRGGVTQIAVGSSPDAALYLVNGGEVSLLTYERSQNVVGWARWITDGTIESITTTSGAGEEDDIYLVVDRGGNRYIEHLTPDMIRVEEDNNLDSLRFLDNYTERIEVTPFTTVSGLSRFDGEEVDTFIDGAPGGLVTVSGGVATLPREALNAVVGLPYTTEVRPMSIDFGAIGSKSSIIELLIRFRNSLGGEVSQDRVNWSSVDQERGRSTDGTPSPLVSSDYQSTPHSTWGRKPSISVRQTQPLPMTILAMRLKTKSSK